MRLALLGLLVSCGTTNLAGVYTGNVESTLICKGGASSPSQGFKTTWKVSGPNDRLVADTGGRCGPIYFNMTGEYTANLSTKTCLAMDGVGTATFSDSNLIIDSRGQLIYSTVRTTPDNCVSTEKATLVKE